MELTSMLATLFVVIGALVFLVNVIVQVTKQFVPIKTDFYVLILSIILSIISYFVYIGYTGSSFVWYYFVAAVFLGFLVCYVAQNGWEKFIKLWEESQKDKES